MHNGFLAVDEDEHFFTGGEELRRGRSSKQVEIEGMSIENFYGGVGSFEMGFHGIGMWGKR